MPTAIILINQALNCRQSFTSSLLVFKIWTLSSTVSLLGGILKIIETLEAEFQKVLRMEAGVQI